jgi:SAM-dependent methyltransferase
LIASGLPGANAAARATAGEPGPPVVAVGLLSAAALAYEVLLVRIFAIVHWHHSVETAISLALLGFGASGTFLSLAGARLRRHATAVFVVNAVLFAVAAVACVQLAQRVAFDPLAVAWRRGEIVHLAALFLLLAVPLFAAANCIGIALYRWGREIPRIYAYDLVGAGIGAALLLFGLWLASPEGLLLVIAAAGCVAALVAAAPHGPVARRLAMALVAIAVVGVLLLPETAIRPAPYKDLARALAAGDTAIVAASGGPAGSLAVVRNDAAPFRYAPGLSLQSLAVPPRQLAVYRDGDLVGALPDPAARGADAAFQRDRLSALAHLLAPAARTAVLNAGSGDAVRQALALGATRVVAIEPDPQLVALVCPGAGEGGAAARPDCDPDRVQWITQSARAYVAGPPAAFDLVRLDVHPDLSGLDAMAIDFDLTAEAMRAYLAQLAPGGLLAVSGPVRYPPSLSLRLLAGARDALAASGVAEPAMQVAMLRGWRDFLLLVSSGPIGAEREAVIRGFAARLGFDLVWLPTLDGDEVNRYHRLASPDYHLGARAVFATPPVDRAGRGELAVVPATDDRPYAYRFSDLGEALRSLLRPGTAGEGPAGSDIDVGLVLGVAVALIAVAAALILIVVPLLFVRRRSTAGPPRLRVRVLGYFAAIGIAFLLIEIAWIQRLQLFLGHPVHATTLVLAAFLVFAGLGSLFAQGIVRTQRALRLAIAAIALLGLGYLWVLPMLLSLTAPLPLAARAALALLLMAPVAFAMGMPFPLALRHVEADAPGLVPWAWAINGSMSVISAATAPLLAMQIGASGMVLVATAAYVTTLWSSPAAMGGGP